MSLIKDYDDLYKRVQVQIFVKKYLVSDEFKEKIREQIEHEKKRIKLEKLLKSYPQFKE